MKVCKWFKPGKSINMARQSEETKKQQNTLRSDASSVVQMDAASVDRVFEGRRRREMHKFNKYKSDGAKPHFSSQSRHPHSSQCYKCGGPPHPRHECPANDAKCHSCGEKGHFQRVYRAGENVDGIETEEEDESFFLGSVTSDKAPWTTNIRIRNTTIRFKLDTGADVTAVSQTDINSIFSDTQQSVLPKVERPLLGPRLFPLDVSGFARLQLRSGNKQTKQKVYVVKNLSTPLL